MRRTLLMITAAGCAAKSLTLSPEGVFLIAQFADLHYGEGENVAWGPEQDKNSTRVMRSILASEMTGCGASDCLVAFSGDQITGNNVETNATEYWSMLLQPTASAQLPLATIMGNHDDAPCCSQGPSAMRSVTTRSQLVAYEQSHFPTSFTQAGPAQLHGVTNYMLTIAASSSNASVVAALLFLDSGGGSYPEVVFDDQVTWAHDMLTNATTQYGAIPIFVYVHIPMPEYANAYVPLGPGSPCVGVLDADGITPTLNNTGLFSTLAAFPTVRAVFTGHDHGNAWCCPLASMNLCYGRHTGYGGYGDWDRGARMLRLAWNETSSALDVQTWVRMEDGSMNSQQLL